MKRQKESGRAASSLAAPNGPLPAASESDNDEEADPEESN